MSAAAPIRFKDFQESDLILYVAYFLKGPLGPPSSCPWLAVSRDACATSLNVAAERLESRVKCITEAAQRKRKKHAGSPRDPDRPSRPPAKKKQSRHRSPHGAASQGERPSTLFLKAGNWTGLLAVC